MTLIGYFEYCNSELPIHEHVIKRVDDLTTKEEKPDTNNEYHILEWSIVITITDQADIGPNNEE